MLVQEDFSTDIIRIIQYNINALGKDEQEQAKTGKKDAIGHIRSTFIKVCTLYLRTCLAGVIGNCSDNEQDS